MKAIYPGSFDFFHKGHKDIVIKAAKLFDEVIVVVTKNTNKPNATPISERMNKAIEMTNDLTNVSVMQNSNLLTVEFAHQIKATYIVRGLRDVGDLKYELEYYDANKMLDASIETIYFVSDEDKRKISSTMLKEIEQYRNKRN